MLLKRTDDEFSIDMVTNASSSTITSNCSTNSFTQTGSASSEASVFTVNDTESDWSVTLEMNGADVAFKIDTGAQCNVIPKHLLQKFSPKPKIKPATIKLSAYNGTSIPVSGKCIGKLKLKDRTVNVLFIVVDSDSVPILGLNTSVKLNLINQTYQISMNAQFTTPIQEEFSDCFGEIGCLPRVHHIEIRDDVKPVITPVRKVRFALKPKLKKELKRMVDLETIEQVEKPTDWVNALVMVSKPNGDLRICLDPRHLNKAIKRQHHRLPTAEEIISEMAGACYFSKLDASSGFWQVKVDDEGADLLTFGTRFGRYRFKRLPFGIDSASDVSEQKLLLLSRTSPDASTPKTTSLYGAQQRRTRCLPQKRSYSNSWIKTQQTDANAYLLLHPLHSSVTNCLQKVCNPIHPKLKLSYKCHFPSQSPTFNALWAWSTTLESSSQIYRKSLRPYASYSRKMFGYVRLLMSR